MLAKKYLHKHTAANSIHSRREIKTVWKKLENMSLVVHLQCLHEKRLLVKLLFDSLQAYANQLWGLVLANCTRFRCVNLCPPVLIRGRISDHKQVYSYIHTSTEQDP